MTACVVVGRGPGQDQDQGNRLTARLRKRLVQKGPRPPLVSRPLSSRRLQDRLHHACKRFPPSTTSKPCSSCRALSDASTTSPRPHNDAQPRVGVQARLTRLARLARSRRPGGRHNIVAPTGGSRSKKHERASGASGRPVDAERAHQPAPARAPVVPPLLGVFCDFRRIPPGLEKIN